MNMVNPPSEAYRVEASAAGQTTPRTQTCASGGSCFIFFNNFMPSQVSIRVVLVASATTWGSVDASPVYNPVFPNGFECGAACHRGFVVVRAT